MMFAIDSHKIIDTDVPVIAYEYDVLLEYDEPILYVGRNVHGTRIIGSSVDEDVTSGISRHFAIAISECDYSRYYRGEVSYRELMNVADIIYVIDKRWDNGTKRTIAALDINDVPEDYLPSKDTFHPRLQN